MKIKKGMGDCYCSVLKLISVTSHEWHSWETIREHNMFGHSRLISITQHQHPKDQ